MLPKKLDIALPWVPKPMKKNKPKVKMKRKWKKEQETTCLSSSYFYSSFFIFIFTIFFFLSFFFFGFGTHSNIHYEFVSRGEMYPYFENSHPTRLIKTITPI